MTASSSQRSPRLTRGLTPSLGSWERRLLCSVSSALFLERRGHRTKSAEETPPRAVLAERYLGYPVEGGSGVCPPNTSRHRASRTGRRPPVGSLSPPETPRTPASRGRRSTPELCGPPPGLERSLPSRGEPLRATRFKPLTSSTPAGAAGPAPFTRPSRPAPPRGSRFTGRPREYSRRPRAARGRH